MNKSKNNNLRIKISYVIQYFPFRNLRMIHSRITLTNDDIRKLRLLIFQREIVIL